MRIKATHGYTASIATLAAGMASVPGCARLKTESATATAADAAQAESGVAEHDDPRWQAAAADVDRALRKIRQDGLIGWDWPVPFKRHGRIAIRLLVKEVRKPGELQGPAAVALGYLHNNEPEVVDFIEEAIPDPNADIGTRRKAMHLLFNSHGEDYGHKMLPVLEKLIEDTNDPIHEDKHGLSHLHTVARMFRSSGSR